MKKNTYLKNMDVVQFIEWLSANLDNGTLAHSYVNRRSGSWRCASLYDAYLQYHWPHAALPRLSLSGGVSFTHNAHTLGVLQRQLQHALTPQLNDPAACVAAIDVMTWGGVRAGNVRWLHSNQAELANLLSKTRDALNANDTDHSDLNDSGLRFNAGMTKVYSLLSDSLIIYDSRVAAALGWTVTKYCQDKGMSQVPAELSFAWAPAKTAPGHPDPKRRNPSVGTLKFPSLAAGARHAGWNLKASWLLSAVLASPAAKDSKFTQNNLPQKQLRAIEAALFMIGYDLGQVPSTPRAHNGASPSNPKNVSASVAPASTDTPLVNHEWDDCYTLGRRIPFRYRVDEIGIEIDGGRLIKTQEVNEVLTLLWKHFGERPFPLANSATDVRDGSAPMGLGTAWFKALDRNPPESSKVAAVLEELGVLLPTDSASARGLQWVLNATLLEIDEGEEKVDIKPVLQACLAQADEL